MSSIILVVEELVTWVEYCECLTWLGEGVLILLKEYGYWFNHEVASCCDKHDCSSVWNFSIQPMWVGYLPKWFEPHYWFYSEALKEFEISSKVFNSSNLCLAPLIEALLHEIHVFEDSFSAVLGSLLFAALVLSSINIQLDIMLVVIEESIWP